MRYEPPTFTEMMTSYIGYMVIAIIVIGIIIAFVYGMWRSYRALVDMDKNLGSILEICRRDYEMYKCEYENRTNDMCGEKQADAPESEEYEKLDPYYIKLDTMLKWCRPISEDVMNDVFTKVVEMIRSHDNPLPTTEGDGSFYDSIRDIIHRPGFTAIRVPVKLKDNDLALLTFRMSEIPDYSKWEVVMDTQRTEIGADEIKIPCVLTNEGDKSVYLTLFQLVAFLDLCDADEVIVNTCGEPVIVTLFKNN